MEKDSPAQRQRPPSGSPPPGTGRSPYPCLQQTLGAPSPKASLFVSLRSARAPRLARPLASLLQKFVPLKRSVVVSRSHFFFFNKGKRNSQMLLGHQVVLQNHDPDEFGVIEPKPCRVVFSGMPGDQRTRVCKGLGGEWALSPSRPLTRRGLSQRQTRAVLPYSCTSQPQDHRRGPRNPSAPRMMCLEAQGHRGGVTVPQSCPNSLGRYWWGQGVVVSAGRHRSKSQLVTSNQWGQGQIISSFWASIPPFDG